MSFESRSLLPSTRLLDRVLPTRVTHLEYARSGNRAERNIHKIFKVRKSKHAQPGILYLARLTFKIEGQEKVKAVHHHQMSIT